MWRAILDSMAGDRELIQIVDADLETVGLQFGDQIRGDHIISLGDEIKGGTEAQLHLEFRELPQEFGLALRVPFWLAGSLTAPINWARR